MLQQLCCIPEALFNFLKRDQKIFERKCQIRSFEGFLKVSKSYFFVLFFTLSFLSFQILVVPAQFSGFPAQLYEVHHFFAAAPLPFHPDFCSFGHAIVRWNFQFPWRNTSFEFQLLFHCHAHRLSGQFFSRFSHHFSELWCWFFSTPLELPFFIIFYHRIVVNAS